ncbi:MAG: NAD(P)-binding protein [Mycolicibacterium sp.]|uniref:NAD(P)-binding protein n=1 Tax=Mycolicibacterium sp. TaxID=2320850 RepID=UPI003D12AA96
MTPIEADYLVVGAGAMGMAFVDTLLAETDATVVLVDENHQPGGHWNSVYPFVRLHQPSAYYGVNSRALGNEDSIDPAGWNEGFFELATGHEVCAYYDQVMRHQLLPTGRLSYFPSARYLGDNVFQTLDGARHEVTTRRRIVDATYLLTVVQSMRPAPFAVAADVDLVTPNDLPRRAAGRPHYTIVGGGKTGMDCCLWLLRSGVPAERIRWVMPRDSWMLNRANVQPGPMFVDRLKQSIAARLGAIAAATTVDDLMIRLEADQNLLRLDPGVHPTMYHCAIVSVGELEQLRSIADVIRMGHVTRAEPDRLVLADGTIFAPERTLYVDCTTQGLPRPPSVPVFEGDRITLQSVRGCQQVFSSAFIAHVEARYPDDVARNDLCTPIPHPDAPSDWLRIMLSDNLAQIRWARDPELMEWLQSCRLNLLRGLFPKFPADRPRVREKAIGALTAELTRANKRLAALLDAS